MKEVALFGGGCFWCTEAVFKMLKGVLAVEPGYAGGEAENPIPVEVVRVEYDSEKVSFRDLMTVFFGSHDATQVNRQGNDVGEQYRSVIFYTSDSQKKEAESFIEDLTASVKDGKPIVTTVESLSHYSTAEEYHKNYYANNEHAGYCQVIIAPKLQKVQKEFADLLKTHII